MTRRTKIIATIGPASESETVLRGMIRGGMDVARLGLAHGTIEDAIGRLKMIRNIAKEENKTVGILVDLPGPKIRLASFGDSPILLAEDSEIKVQVGNSSSDDQVIQVDYKNLFDDVELGDRLIVGDGRGVIQVEEKHDTHLDARVIHGGVMSGRPGLYIPASRLSISAPTEWDLQALERFLEMDVDMVALSFVRSASDLAKLSLDPHPTGPLVVAKIETRDAVEDLTEIIEASGAVMVARGDLGNEWPIQELPILQKEIIRKCIAFGRPAITATQMLESMIIAPDPTRAEVSDVANAVWDGTSALMLSGETAVGADPVNALETMSRVAERADEVFDHRSWGEELPKMRLTDTDDPNTSVTDAMTQATYRAVTELGVETILCISGTGFTVRSMARFRPTARIIGLTSNTRTVGQLSLSWGTESMHLKEGGDVESRINAALHMVRDRAGLKAGELVAVLAGTNANARATNVLRIEQIPHA
ncbi:MAG: pyruvate kinase [Acidimicrobiales bacterium]|jgi:pyruvate kinase|nr:pyruvate kinase [Acidimicrobiaceae bacterium]MDP6162091.1 pyruvate kinase [Acidimicrobiales bacterium]MDP6323391.1 pyruvate kinase [Acidimicrobiales bacterium]HJL91381.1 pyruvate kinase [Acidimicrobiales bacterium]HJO40065.1 pyruvate kinase [Acidimicrobiales bacterium]